LKSRIARLSAIRNEALRPLWDNPAAKVFDDVLFLNDVVWQPEQALRLLSWRSASPSSSQRQRRQQKRLRRDGTAATQGTVRVDMACGLDFNVDADSGAYHGFYDIWVAKDSAGKRLMQNAPFVARPQDAKRLKAGLPVSAYCCWNGGVAMDASLCVLLYIMASLMRVFLFVFSVCLVDTCSNV